MEIMDPVTIATAILTFSSVVSDLATIRRKFSEAPKVLADIEQDCRITLITVLHTAMLKRIYRSSETPAFRDPGVNIVLELAKSIRAIREAVLQLLKHVNEATAPSGSALFKTWKKRVDGFCSLPAIQKAHKEICRNMDAFERLRRSSDSEILHMTLHAVTSRNSASSSDTSSFDQLTITDAPVQLPPTAIKEGRQTLLNLIYDRRPGSSPDERYNLDLIGMILFECNIDPNFATSDHGMYPLHLAAKQKDAQLAKLLLQHGAKVSVHDSHGRTPLHVAELGDSVSVVKAILSNDINCIETFLDRANALDTAGHPVLWNASARKQPSAVFNHLLTLPPAVINFRSPSDTQYPTALWAAASPQGSLETARALLLQANADPFARAETDNSSTLLHKVSWPTVCLLYRDLIAKSKPTKTDLKPEPDSKPAPDFVYCKAPNASGAQPIHLAAAAGNFDLCLALLESGQGVDIDAPDRQGATPLSLAAEAGHIRLVYDFVVHRGADVTIRDEFGHDAFASACSGGHVDVACFLLGRQFVRGDGRAGSRGIDEVDGGGLSAVYIAAVMGHVGVVKLLVELGASTEGIDEDKIGSMMEGGKGDGQLRVNAIRKLLGLEALEVSRPVAPPRHGSLRLRRNRTR